MNCKTILKKSSIFICCSFFLLNQYGCQKILEQGGDARLPEAAGDFAEMVVLCDLQSTPYLKKHIDSVFATDAPGLPPPPEQNNKLRYTDQTFFKGFFKKHYQVFVFASGDNWPLLKDYFDDHTSTEILKKIQSNKAGTITFSNLWAKPQQVHVVYGSHTKELIDYIDSHRLFLNRIASVGERKVGIQKIYGSGIYKDSLFVNQFNAFGFGIAKPASFRVALNDPAFKWLRKSGRKYEFGIFIYDEPFQAEKQFTQDYILNLRNLKTKNYIKGQLDSTYMSIENQFPATSTVIEFNEMYAVETRGWWKLENDFMGGPFVSYTVLTKDKGRIVTVEGNVYAPNEDKVKLLRELEVILSTLKVK